MKEAIKKLAKRLGYEVLGPPRAYANQRSLIGLLRREQINLVLDVGANVGHFGEELRALGYAGRILSFEPTAAAHAHLLARAKNDPAWTVADRTAVGATTGSVTMHIANNSESSSLLNMLPSHSQAAPESVYVGTETVPLKRLDDLYPVAAGDRALLKIDVQGYEEQVLQGAPRLLQGCRAIIAEMSLVALYSGQPLAYDMWALIANHGFEPWSVEPVFGDQETGRLLQFDAAFVRSGTE